MKSGNIPVEVWKCLGEAAVEFLTSLFNRVLESERMPEEWRRSVLVPIFKNKGDVQSCSNYRGIKLRSHTMKLWERVVEARLRKVVEICEQQYGFMPRKSTTDAIFALRILMEKYRDGQRELHCVFVDLEKAYDRVPREELWYCMRKSGVAEKYVRVVQDMYERSRTVVRCAIGQIEEFKVEVGLHQGSALSPFLFAMVSDQLSEEVRQESPWTMMFADDIVICSESREQVEENLERWRFALERRGMKVSRSKTEYMCVNEREGSGTVRLQGEEVQKVQEFKYLGSTVQSNGECGKEVKKRVQAGWNGWRKVSGVLCDRKISARIKGKVYRTVVRAAMLYGLETESLRKRQESELEVAELKMLRFSLGVTRLDRIRNEYIRGTAHVGRLGDKVREARLRWFGHVQRREKGTGGGGNDDLFPPAGGGGGGKSSELPAEKCGRAPEGTGGGGNDDLFPPICGSGGGKLSELPAEKCGRAPEGTGGGGSDDLFPPASGGGGRKSFEDPEENVLGDGRVLDGTGGGGKDVWWLGGAGFAGKLGRRPGCVGGVEWELGNRPPGKGGGPPGCELLGEADIGEGTGGVLPLLMFDRPEGAPGKRGGDPPLGAGNLPP
ncbi:hypothetical protein QTP86_026541, partial [Hemibagrus guttatus]